MKSKKKIVITLGSEEYNKLKQMKGKWTYWKQMLRNGCYEHNSKSYQ